MIRRLAAAGLLAVLVYQCQSSPADHSSVPVRTIPLPGVEGRFDHAAFDSATHRLFFAALGNDTLEVVNIETGTRVHTITGLKKPTGVLFLKEWNRIVVASGDDGTCRFYDGDSFAETGRLTALDDADNLRFDAQAKRVYLGCGEGSLAVIDPAGMKLTSTIPLSRHPESFQLEETGPRIFVNVPGAGHIAVVDRLAGRVVDTWPLAGAGENFPMALDETRHRLFIGCRQPARLLVFDTRTGKQTAACDMGGDVDDVFFDPGAECLLASCGAGFLDVFHALTSGGLERVRHQPTAAGARTCFRAVREPWLCLAVPHRDHQGAELRLYQVPQLAGK